MTQTSSIAQRTFAIIFSDIKNIFVIPEFRRAKCSRGESKHISIISRPIKQEEKRGSQITATRELYRASSLSESFIDDAHYPADCFEILFSCFQFHSLLDSVKVMCELL